jgi:phosphopantetheinyl transferase
MTGAPQRLPLAKDAFSKPFFPENQHLACSLSHSHGIVGAFILNNQQTTNNQQQITCGCDIQVLVPKMPRLAPKFLNLKESKFVQKHTASAQYDLFHVFWTAKESLYKAYGLKALDFRAHLRVEPFKWKENTGTAKGWVEKEDFRQAYRLHFEKIFLPGDAGELVWTVCLPSG